MQPQDSVNRNPLLSLAAWLARRMPASTRALFYRFPPLARFIRRSLNAAAPRDLAVVQVAAGGLQGFSLLLDLQTEKDYWLGTYEPHLQSALADWLQPGVIFYDVGANIGYVSLLAASRLASEGIVFAFEALPANLERLRQNISLNHLGNQIVTIPAAVVETDHPVRFLVGPSGGMGKVEGSAGRQNIKYPQVIEVPGISLDQFVYQAGNPVPQAIKIDIEGGEVLALPGMRRLISEARPIIFLELHGPEAARVGWHFLTQAGYQIHRMQSGYPQVHTLSDLEWKAYLLALPELAHER